MAKNEVVWSYVDLSNFMQLIPMSCCFLPDSHLSPPAAAVVFGSWSRRGAGGDVCSKPAPFPSAG